jgi:pimeloyl-ACP methyl ester carboxylesterase
LSEAVTLVPPEPAVDADGRPIIDAGPDAPAWAQAALAARPDEQRINVGGTEIEALVWGDTPTPGLLLAHGHGAHADWWRPIAPQLVGSAGRVVAYSMGGMGGSGWRDSYSFDLFEREMLEVAETTGLIGPGRRPWLVAHSFGCLQTLMAAAKLKDAITGIVLVDMYLPAPGRSRARPEKRGHRRYDTFAEAMGRFRLSPLQDIPNPWLVDFVGRRTLRRRDDHWTWCTDPGASIGVEHDEFRDRLAVTTVPVVLMRGERSRLVDHEVAAHVLSVAPAGTRMIEIPDADHHVLLDQPLALVAALRTLLSGDSQ